MIPQNSSSPENVVHRFHAGNIHLSIFKDHKATIQRSYPFSGRTKYANSLRLEDVKKAIEALQEFKRWAGLQELAASIKDKNQS